ncbi:MAG: alcohol acetyltransferase [Arachnia sp.]
MTRRTWVRLDNASNIFLAARTDADPKVFRMTTELDHDVDPVVLQQALDATFDRFPLYHAVLRRGVFWYYLQDSDLRPVVEPEMQYPCAPIYHEDRRTLLFRVVHHGRRIIVEVFHALSDGTGALWFVTDLVTEYVARRMAEPGLPAAGASVEDAGPTGVSAGGVESAGAAAEGAAAPLHDLTVDSFAHHFHRRPRGAPAAPVARRPRRRVHRVKGTRTPDNRPRVVELTMPAGEVLARARAEGVALSAYLTALFFEAVRLSSGGLGRRPTLTASVPVNLRQFFPSTSARNFFATIRLEHTYGEGADDLGAICRDLEGQLRDKITPEALERKLRRLIRLERNPALRVFPRAVKDLILGLVNWATNRGLTVAISNLGLVRLPEPAESHVARMLFHVSAVRPQFCAISHAGLLTVSFTSPFMETSHIREFARLLTTAGVRVSVAAGLVTEEELAGAEQ